MTKEVSRPDLTYIRAELHKLTRSHLEHSMADILNYLHEVMEYAEKLEAVEKAAREYLSECQPHPCPDLALRAQYRSDLRKALSKLETKP